MQKPLMEDKYSMQRQHSGIWRSLRDGDFEEEEIWDVIKENPDYNSGFFKPKESFSSSSAPLPVPRPLSTAARMIPRANNSSSHEANKVVQQSAPVNIPDWSKIYSNNQPKNVSKFDDYSFGQEDNYEGVFNYGGDTDDEEEDEDDGYDPKLPPHEFIARRLARCQISSFSVCEGVGRTLKGRDLSKVRNAVLIKTGFLESL